MRPALIGALTVILVSSGIGALERARAAPPPSVSELLAEASSCPATLVRYGVTVESPRDTAPWIAAGPGRTRLVGLLYPYRRLLGDARVRLAPGFTLYAGRLEKIAWVPHSWGDDWGRYLTIEGRRLDGPGTFQERFRRAVAPQFYPTGLTVPSVGCWRLTLRSARRSVSVVVQAIEPPAERPCDLSEVGSDGIPATPASAGVLAGWHWQTAEGGALMYVGGRTPEGGNTKVLWRVERGYTQMVRLLGSRLDGAGNFDATLPAVSVPGAFPSTVVVPSAGCWLLTIRTGSIGGVIVFRAVAP
ncbi:MAG: hypothetical protein H0V68_07140 [Actinobacteria bacterium]|nr:hypothetical protein [Actinomycetota bacterium]